MVGTILAGALAAASIISSIYANHKNQQNADKQLDYQKYLNANQIQLQAQDYQKAGINPALAGMSGSNLSSGSYNSNQQGFDISGLASTLISTNMQKKMNDDSLQNQTNIVNAQTKSAEKIASEKVASEETISREKIASQERVAMAELAHKKEYDKPLIELNKSAVSQSSVKFAEEVKKLRSENAISVATATNMCLKNAIQTVTGRDDGLGIPNLQVGSHSLGATALTGSISATVSNADIINALKTTSNLKNEKAIYKTFKENLENAGLPVPSYVSDRLRDSTVRYNGAKVPVKRHN